MLKEMRVGQVLDAASAVDPAAVKAGGWLGVMRYISDFANTCITVGEFDTYEAAGLPVGFVFENDVNDVEGGVDAGTAHGQTIAAKLDELAIPPASCVVYLACDENLPVSSYPTSLAYVQAAQRAGGFIPGGYGPGPWLQYLGQMGIGRFSPDGTFYGWECASSSYNNGVAAGQLRQLVEQVTVGGVVCDVNDVFADDWGQWPRLDPPKPKPEPPQEALMHAVVHDGTIYVYAVGADSRAGHFQEWSRPVGGATWSVIDVTDEIHKVQTAEDPPYTVAG